MHQRTAYPASDLTMGQAIHQVMTALKTWHLDVGPSHFKGRVGIAACGARQSPADRQLTGLAIALADGHPGVENLQEIELRADGL